MCLCPILMSYTPDDCAESCHVARELPFYCNTARLIEPEKSQTEATTYDRGLLTGDVDKSRTSQKLLVSYDFRVSN